MSVFTLKVKRTMGVICAKCFPREWMNYFGTKIILIETNIFVKLQRMGTRFILIILYYSGTQINFIMELLFHKTFIYPSYVVISQKISIYVCFESDVCVYIDYISIRF